MFQSIFVLIDTNKNYLLQGSIFANIKYHRASFMNEHSHDLKKSFFTDSYNLVRFLDEDLLNFGSNTQPRFKV